MGTSIEAPWAFWFPFVSEVLACNADEHVPVGLRAIHYMVYVADGTNDDTPNGPKHLQHLGGRGSQLDGYDLATICRRVGNEDTPWNALENLGDEKDFHGLGKVEDKDEGVKEHEADQGRVTVSDAAGEGTSDEDADESTELPRHLKRRLPLGDDDILAGCGTR